MSQLQNVYVVNPVASGGGEVEATLAANTTGGWNTLRNIDLGNTGQVIKASAGQVGGYFISNTGEEPVYVKIYNKSTAPTNADTPALTLTIPGAGAANLLGTIGLQFSTGISWRATTGVADADTTAPATNQVVANVFFV